MKQENKIESMLLKAEKGMTLPIFYNGKIHRITDEKVHKIEISKLPHESKIHIDQALKNKTIKQLKGESKE